MFPLGSLLLSAALAQVPSTTTADHTPIATQWVLDAAGPTQRSAIDSVYMIVCPTSNKKGTAFLTEGNIMVTDNHVVDGCAAPDLWAQSSRGRVIHFSRVISDGTRDLALLRPSVPINGGLKLGSDSSLKTGQGVTTWGFPLIFQRSSPLAECRLSRWISGL